MWVLVNKLWMVLGNCNLYMRGYFKLPTSGYQKVSEKILLNCRKFIRKLPPVLRKGRRGCPYLSTDEVLTKSNDDKMYWVKSRNWNSMSMVECFEKTKYTFFLTHNWWTGQKQRPIDSFKKSLTLRTYRNFILRYTENNYTSILCHFRNWQYLHSVFKFKYFCMLIWP